MRPLPIMSWGALCGIVFGLLGYTVDIPTMIFTLSVLFGGMLISEVFD